MKNKNIKAIALLLIVAACITSEVRAKCSTRKDVFHCILKRGDKNNDGMISLKEMKKVEDKYISWWVRIPYDMFGGTKQVYKDCDINLDNKISLDEVLNGDSCLNTCDKRNKVFNVLQC